MNSKYLTSFVLSAAFVVFACSDGGGTASGADGGGGGGELLATGEGPCESAEECEGGVCVALIDGDHPPVYCSQECGDCPDGFYCDEDLFALAGLSFCRFGDTPQQSEPPEEPPRRPCRSDAECAPGVCATYHGERGCTIACDDEEECTLPPVGGVTFDMMECLPDQGAERDVCLPDADCFPDPSVCIDVDVPL